MQPSTLPKKRGRRSLGDATLEQSGSTAFHPLLEAARRHGTLLRLRRKQKIAIAPEDEPVVHLVQAGALFVELEMGVGRRQILLLLLPGDAYDSRLIPSCTQCRLMSAGPTETLRLSRDGISAFETEAPAEAIALTRRWMAQLARALVHHGAIGRLSGEERVAAFLLEIGARSRVLGPEGGAIELPLTRGDIADYLALNADTLSRIMSRLRAKGAIGRNSRGRLPIRSWQALRAITPLSEAIWQD